MAFTGTAQAAPSRSYSQAFTHQLLSSCPPCSLTFFIHTGKHSYLLKGTDSLPLSLFFSLSHTPSLVNLTPNGNCLLSTCTKTHTISIFLRRQKLALQTWDHSSKAVIRGLTTGRLCYTREFPLKPEQDLPTNSFRDCFFFCFFLPVEADQVN